MTPGKVAYVLLLGTVLALAVVWQNATLRRTGYRVQELRTQAAEQRSRTAAYRAHLGKLRNPRRIVRLVAWLELDLRAPSVSPIDGTAVAEAEETRETSSPVTVAEAPRQTP
ncbi:MAG: hypothetical protein R6X33_19260 [Candidatus Brocadiia bacterium]